MKVLAVHNYYQQPGGEDLVFADETRMLEAAGHTVIRVTETNDRVAEYSRAGLLATTFWNGKSYRRLRGIAAAEKPDVVHFHNTFPLISPSGYYAVRGMGAAVVQTLHNYRLICPAATLLREGKPCEECVGAAVAWKGIQHRCYRGSAGASATVAGMLGAHRLAGTWKNAVDAYIILTDFARSRFIDGGLPPERLFKKGNFLDVDPGAGSGGDQFVFAGRFGAEKGLDVLIDTWRTDPELPVLKIIGDGELAPWLLEAIADLPNVHWLGRLPREEVMREMRRSRAVVLPSVCYEGFPLLVVEAFAAGTPVIGSDAGTLPELVRDGVTGYIFRSGDHLDLARKVRDISQNGAAGDVFRRACRNEFEAYYQGDRNCRRLIEIYRQAIRNRSLARN